MASSSSSIDLQTLNPSKNQSSHQPPPPTTSSPSPQLHSLLSKTSSPQLPKIQEPLLYPLASSGRGFIPKTFRPQSTDQLVTVANPGAYPPRSAPQFSNQTRPYGIPHSNSQSQSMSSMRPPTSQSQYGPRFIGGVGVGSAPIKASPTIKSAPFQSPVPGNGYRDPRDTNRDDTVVTVNHRKVRLSDGASLYALCRSWVRNGLPKETQSHLGEGLKLLPRPLPINVTQTQIPEKDGSGDENEEKEEDVSAVENLSARELLQGHVKRAKKVRARLRKERLQRIERYKQRLALLLPSPVEQFRNDIATEN